MTFKILSHRQLEVVCKYAEKFTVNFAIERQLKELLNESEFVYKMTLRYPSTTVHNSIFEQLQRLKVDDKMLEGFYEENGMI